MKVLITIFSLCVLMVVWLASSLLSQHNASDYATSKSPSLGSLFSALK